MSVSKRNLLLVLTATVLLLTGCVIRQVVVACAPDTPGVEKMTINFVCPYVGASYQTEVYKCPGDTHFRVNVACQLCGRHHYYPVSYWPNDYWPDGYFFFGGWWYPHDYWIRYWPYRTTRYPYSYQRPIMTPRPPERVMAPRTVQPPIPMPPARQAQPQARPMPPSQQARPMPPSQHQQSAPSRR